MADDDTRWMIRGVDKGLRKAIKDAAKDEGVSIGNWVRRALRRALENVPDGPVSLAYMNERIQELDRRLAVLEKARTGMSGATDGVDAGSAKPAKEQKR